MDGIVFPSITLWPLLPTLMVLGAATAESSRGMARGPA